MRNDEGTGAKVAHFVASIAYRKWVVLCEQFHGKLNGQTFSDCIHEQFPKAFANSANPRGKLSLQDGDPSQNSKKARDAMDCVGAKKFNKEVQKTVICFHAKSLNIFCGELWITDLPDLSCVRIMGFCSQVP